MTATSTRIGWGILGTGRIAKKLAAAVNASSTGVLVAVGSRNKESADKFGDEFKVPGRYGDYDGVLKDPKVQAVYISLPNHLHAYWTIRCAEAGKHVLCEKPVGMNYPEAMTMAEHCRRHGVFFMEAFMYRCHPQTAKVQQLVKDKVIGDVRVIQANFSYNGGERWEDIRMVNAMGGGGIMDVGCYTASFTRLIAGAALGKDFSDPIEVKGNAVIGEKSKVDEWATASVRFPGPSGPASDILATLTCGMRVGIDNSVRIFGSTGSILVSNPWFPGEKDNKIVVHKAGQSEPEVITVDGGAGLYTIEVDTVARAIAGKRQQAASPCMSWEDTISNMRLLDQWRKSVGLAWDTETAEAMQTRVTGRPLAPLPDADMPKLKIPGLNKPISRVVMGSMIYGPQDLPLTFHMLDYFVEVGGNCIDTAYIYGGGGSEQAIGKWLKARNNREQIVILGKGGHTPHCNPEAIRSQVDESLKRLEVDHIDIYVLHRDNLDLPVGELVDVLYEAHKAGKIGVYGGSNWTTARLDAANEYARKKGIPGFGASSPNLSLAKWNGTPWAGCITASDAESRAWHTKTQMPLFSWSSQAGGLFAGRLKAEDKFHPDWFVRGNVNTWMNDDNMRRLERARELGARKGVTATQIAMAYVINQPFPTFALIGPRTIEEARTSIMGVNLKLTSEELRWLNLEA